MYVYVGAFVCVTHHKISWSLPQLVVEVPAIWSLNANEVCSYFLWLRAKRDLFARYEAFLSNMSMRTSSHLQLTRGKALYSTPEHQKQDFGKRKTCTNISRMRCLRCANTSSFDLPALFDLQNSNMNLVLSKNSLATRQKNFKFDKNKKSVFWR